MSVYKASQQIQSGQFTVYLFFKARKVSAKREEMGWVGEPDERKKRDFLPSTPSQLPLPCASLIKGMWTVPFWDWQLNF